MSIFCSSTRINSWSSSQHLTVHLPFYPSGDGSCNCVLAPMEKAATKIIYLGCGFAPCTTSTSRIVNSWFSCFGSFKAYLYFPTLTLSKNISPHLQLVTLDHPLIKLKLAPPYYTPLCLLLQRKTSHSQLQIYLIFLVKCLLKPSPLPQHLQNKGRTTTGLLTY